MAQSLMPTLPDRWVNCPRRGQLIEDKFLPFKTPLGSHYDPSLEERVRFPPSLLLSISQNLPRPLGIIIDLTNSRRFYSPSELNTIGLQHVKIPCEGHRDPPTKDQTNKFIQLTLQFLSSHREESIGVHCTHGFNRTGFLIVSYLVEQEDWGLSAAVQAFAASREPGIYKQNYLAELYRRYGDGEEESVPAAPERPPWCVLSSQDLGLEVSSTESESSDGEGAVGPAGASGVHRDTLEEVPSIRALSQEDRHMGLSSSQLIHRICELCGHKEGSNHNFPGSQPVTLDHARMSHLLSHKYYVSWKADGTRYMMYIRGKGQVYLLRRDNRIFPVSSITFPHRKPSPEMNHVTETLLDCEMVVEKRANGGRRPYLLLYDLVAYAGDNKFGNMRHQDRIKIIEMDIYDPREKATLALTLDKGKEPFSIRLKEFFPLSKTGQIYNEFIPKLHHEIDGLIFSRDDQGYMPGRCDWLLKWKPLSLNSIDFRLKIVKLIARVGELGGKRYHFLVLEDGTRAEKKFFEFERQFIRKDEFNLEDLDGKIVECTLEGNNIKILRIRTDKTKPNTLSTASNVFSSIQHPLGIDELLEFIKNIPQAIPHSSHSASTRSDKHNHIPTDSLAPPTNSSAPPTNSSAPPTNSSAPPTHSNSHPPQKHRTELNHNAKHRKVESNHSIDSSDSETNSKRPRLDSSGSD